MEMVVPAQALVVPRGANGQSMVISGTPWSKWAVNGH